MALPDDFCVMILTHGRPDSVKTHRVIREYGYSGPILMVIDDEDPQAGRYRDLYGSEVIEFSKDAVAGEFDLADNLSDKRAVVYARNASFKIARDAGFRYFVVLDDDYNSMYYRFDPSGNFGAWRLTPLDGIFEAMLGFFKSVPSLLTLCTAQGGDYIGGASGSYAKSITMTRKAMNLFMCSVDRPFKFPGRINEDTNAYLSEGHRGGLFLTYTPLQVNQGQTQSNSGGLTDIYQSLGTYVKSFYSVMMCPSFVSVRDMGTSSRRLHHLTDWDKAVPKIVREAHRKRSNGTSGKQSQGREAA